MTDAETAQKDLDEATEKLEELTELQGTLAKAEADRDAAKAEVDELQAQLDEKNTQLTEAQARVTEAQAEVDAAEAELTAAREAKPDEVETPDIEGDVDHNGILSQAERDALADAANLDGALTPAEIEAIQAQQAELEAAEAAALERNGAVDGAVESSTDAAAQQALNAELQAQADQEIIDERREYFRQNPYYVDADGTVYAASVNAAGEMVLKRNSTEPAQGDRPEIEVNRSASIETDRSRTDTEVRRTVPQAPTDVVQTRTETVHTDPVGTPTGSEIQLENERTNADRSYEHSLTREVLRCRQRRDGAGRGIDVPRSTGQPHDRRPDHRLPGGRQHAVEHGQHPRGRPRRRQLRQPHHDEQHLRGRPRPIPDRRRVPQRPPMARRAARSPRRGFTMTASPTTPTSRAPARSTRTSHAAST